MSLTNACGILFCYNEGHILKECLAHYLSQGIDLVIVDNNSTDSSMDIAKTFQDNVWRYPGRIQDILYIKTQGYEWQKILRFACDYMHRKLSSYEWILLIDADSFYHSPVRGVPLLEFMDAVKKWGYNIIDGKLCEFYPTEKDDPSVASPIERMLYCKIYYPRPQHKIFLYHPSVDFYTHRGHICLRNNSQMCVIKFLYNHYPWVSYEHGLKKIFEQRDPRYVERKEDPWSHFQYIGILPIKKDLIKQHQMLWRYKKEKILISPSCFFWIMKVRIFIEVYFALKEGINRTLIRKIKEFLIRFWNIFMYDKRLAFRQAFVYVKKKIKAKLRTNMTNQKLPGSSRYQTISLSETIKQEPYVIMPPNTYHFLMTNYCNARCIFCNQISDYHSKKEITLEQFKKMISNIPMEAEGTFVFSGGGEPLLCQDLFPIIKHVNTHFPWIRIYIRTNGLLIRRYARELAQSNILQLEISVHGATPKAHNAILQIEGTQDIFMDIAFLNKYLEYYKSKMRKVFCPTVSQFNIDEVPELVRKAAELKVDEVAVSFCRFYPYESYKTKGKIRAKVEDSLFFSKKKYNSVILKSKRLAKSLNVSFEHEPLFLKRFKEKSCLQPWQNMIIDWDGDIYPCTGGEVWFNEKVKSGKYHFGNVLREDYNQYRNSATYIMNRRSCSRNCKEGFIPECKNCHNTICLQGPDVKCGHILTYV